MNFPFLSAHPQIDLQKMPLGKLSKRQIQSAYALLTEVQQVSKQLLHFTFTFSSSFKDYWIQSQFFLPSQAVSDVLPDSHILDLSNRFYTLIPHDFGMKKPPLLNNLDYIQVGGRKLCTIMHSHHFQNNYKPILNGTKEIEIRIISRESNHSLINLWSLNLTEGFVDFRGALIMFKLQSDLLP